MEVEGETGVPRPYRVLTDSPPSLVMELCPGEPLEKCLRRGELRFCLLALVQVCGSCMTGAGWKDPLP